jgi:hypothetical protein
MFRKIRVVEGGGDAAVQNRAELISAKLQQFTHQLLVSQTFEHFLSELKDVGFCK